MRLVFSLIPAVLIAVPAGSRAAEPAAEGDASVEELIHEARRASINGDRKGALKAFGAAFRLDPKNPAFDRYVPMALGKTGSGTIELLGAGFVKIDGQTFVGPKKLQVAAGQHDVLCRGEARVIEVPKGVAVTVEVGATTAIAKPVASPFGGGDLIEKAPPPGAGGGGLAAAAAPDADQNSVVAVIKKNSKSLQGCYERELRHHESFQPVRLEVEVAISPGGSVQKTTFDKARFEKTELGKCVVMSMRKWRFPPQSKPYKAAFPLVLQPQ